MWFPMISCRELDQWIQEGRAFDLVDLRSPVLYQKYRIRGSRNIPYDQLRNRIGELDREGILVFYCDRGAKSMLVCRSLSDQGFHCVSLAGGIRNYRGNFIDRTP